MLTYKAWSTVNATKMKNMCIIKLEMNTPEVFLSVSRTICSLLLCIFSHFSRNQ